MRRPNLERMRRHPLRTMPKPPASRRFTALELETHLENHDRFYRGLDFQDSAVDIFMAQVKRWAMANGVSWSTILERHDDGGATLTWKVRHGQQ